MATLGSLLFFIRAKNSEFKQKMDESKRKVKEFDEKLDRSKEKIAKWTTIAKKATIGVAAVGTVAIGVGFKLAKLASDAEETQSRFNHVFSGMEDRANEWANAFADDFGQVTSNVQDWLAGLQDTFVPMGIATEKAYAMSKSITQLSIDMGSFYNKKTEDVIRDIQSAIVGQTETVRKYGVIITEARLKQEAVKQGWIEEGEELTELQKIQARYNLLLEGTTKAQGDYKRTQDSFANQLRETSNLLTEIGQNLGKVVLPSFNKGLELVKGLLERFNGWAESINAVKERFESLKEVQDDSLDTVRDLVNEYETLNEKETLNKEERERLVKVSRDLAKLFPSLVTGIDDERNAYEINTEAVLENVRAKNLQFMSGNIRKVIKNIKDEIKALEDRNEDLERLNKNNYPPLEGVVGEARMDLIIIMDQAGLADNVKENMALEDFYDIQKDSDLMQKIKDMGEDTYAAWENAIEVLYHNNERLKERSKEIEENKNKAKELNMELEKEKKLLEAIQKTSEGKMSFEELNKFIEEINEEKPAIKLELEPPSDEEFEETFGKTLSEMSDRERRMRITELNKRRQRKGLEVDLEEEITGKIINELDKRAAARRAKDLRTRKARRGDYDDFSDLEEKTTGKTIEEMDKREAAYRNFLLNKRRMRRGDFDDPEDWAIDPVGKTLEEMDKRERADRAHKIRKTKERRGDFEVQLTQLTIGEKIVAMFESIGYKTNEALQIFQDFRDALVDGLMDAINKGENFLDTLKNIADQIAAMVVKRGIVEPFVDWALSGLGIAHSGALVTTAGLVKDLPSYHSGGKIPGLAADERIIKVLTGERILSRNQNKKFEDGEYGKVEKHYSISINAVDAASFTELVKRNPEAITGVVAGDYQRNGVIRKIIKEGP